MRQFIITLFLALSFISCTNDNSKLIVRNNSKESIYLFCSNYETDSVITNDWLRKYFKDYYIIGNDSFINIRQLIKPNDFITFRDIPIHSTPYFKMYIYVIKCDTNISLTANELDSNLISKVLLKRYVIAAKDVQTKTIELTYE